MLGGPGTSPTVDDMRTVEQDLSEPKDQAQRPIVDHFPLWLALIGLSGLGLRVLVIALSLTSR